LRSSGLPSTRDSQESSSCKPLYIHKCNTRSFAFLINARQEGLKQRARDVLLCFLEDKSQKENLKSDFRRFCTLVHKVQRDWRSRKSADEEKLNSLGALWEKEKLIMMEYFKTNGGTTKGSPNKKNKSQMNKLKMLSDEVKWDFLRKYFAKAKTEFNICFIEYRLDLNPTNFQLQIYEYLDKLKKTLKEFDKDLFLGIKSDPILEWVSVAALKKAAREANPNLDII